MSAVGPRVTIRQTGLEPVDTASKFKLRREEPVSWHFSKPYSEESQLPANIGEMFYTGKTPWHGEGIKLGQPATLAEALKVGGLNWEVGEVEMVTADDPPSPVLKRKAIVRLDRPAGHEGRVLGVAHRGFAPVQNRDAALLVGAIFGRDERVYHTGGYLGDGEVVWLLGRIDRTLRIKGDDVVEPYALMANSHDGSMAFNIRLTTVRVVCQNTWRWQLTSGWVSSFDALTREGLPSTPEPRRILHCDTPGFGPCGGSLRLPGLPSLLRSDL
jgi:Domain of unknown function (DUF932)